MSYSFHIYIEFCMFHVHMQRVRGRTYHSAVLHDASQFRAVLLIPQMAMLFLELESSIKFREGILFYFRVREELLFFALNLKKVKPLIKSWIHYCIVSSHKHGGQQ